MTPERRKQLHAKSGIGRAILALPPQPSGTVAFSENGQTLPEFAWSDAARAAARIARGIGGGLVGAVTGAVKGAVSGNQKGGYAGSVIGSAPGAIAGGMLGTALGGIGGAVVGAVKGAARGLMHPPARKAMDASDAAAKGEGTHKDAAEAHDKAATDAISRGDTKAAVHHADMRMTHAKAVREGAEKKTSESSSGPSPVSESPVTSRVVSSGSPSHSGGPVSHTIHRAGGYGSGGPMSTDPMAGFAYAASERAMNGTGSHEAASDVYSQLADVAIANGDSRAALFSLGMSLSHHYIEQDRAARFNALYQQPSVDGAGVVGGPGAGGGAAPAMPKMLTAPKTPMPKMPTLPKSKLPR